MNDNKAKKQTYSKRISEKIKELLKDYLNNIDFDMSYNNSHFVFEVKDVEVRSDILKKFGIPLELTKGKIQEIKVTVKSLTLRKPILIEVTGINMDVRTIYLSRDYKKDFKNFRQKILDEWEKNHREFLQNLMKKDTLLERTIFNTLIPMKIEINNVKVVITDTVTSHVNKKIALVIGSINSYGCDQSWEPILVQKEEMEESRRIFNVNKLYVSIYQEKYVREEDTENVGTDNCFIQPLDFLVKALFPVKKNPNLRKLPKLHLEINIESPILFDVSISKLRFLISFLNYLSKINKVEKYWIHRPEIKDDKINATMAKEWFKYAFRVVREEVRKRKRQTHDFTSLIEKIINMEKYVQFYKTSHKLIIAPWIRYNDCNEDLKALENKMTLEDILYCREIAFTELITEGKAFCASGEIGEGYKPLIHLWEFYVNDLRSKWMNKSESNEKIRLSTEERRDLMMLANLDKDKVILSYLKGEPNHPEDILSSFKVNFDIIIINISRKVKYSVHKYEKLKLQSELEVTEQMKFYYGIYNGILNKQLQKCKFIECLNNLTEEDIRGIILEENKVDNQNDSHVEDERDDGNKMITTEINREFELRKISDNDRNNNINMSYNENEGIDKESINTGVYSDKLYAEKNIRNVRPNLRLSTRVENNNIINDDSDSVDYLDELVDLNNEIDNMRGDYMNINNHNNNQNINSSNNLNSNFVTLNQLNPKPTALTPGIIRDTSIINMKKLPIKNSNSINTVNSSTLNPNQSRLKTQQFFGNSFKPNEIPYININNINNVPKKNTEENNINNNPNKKFTSNIFNSNMNPLIQKGDSSGKMRKTIVSLVLGQVNVSRKVLRNDEEDTNIRIHSLNLIDHNLTYTFANKHNEYSQQMDSDSLASSDSIRIIFEQIFCENEYNAYLQLEEKNVDPNENSEIYMELSFAKFLIELLMIQKNRDSILVSKEVSHEKNFLYEFIYKFGFRELDYNSDLPNVEEYYQRLVIAFLLEKDIFKEKLQVIERIIKQTKRNYLLHEKYNIFNRKFITKVFEKAISKNLFGFANPTAKFGEDAEGGGNYMNTGNNTTLGNAMTLGLNKGASSQPNHRISNNLNKLKESDFNMKKEERIKGLMIADMNFLMEEICVNLMKYVISSMYPYFLHHRGVQVVFKKNIKLFCEKISEKLREENKKSNTFTNVHSYFPEKEFFLILRKTKKGREYPHYIYKENDSLDKEKKGEAGDKLDKDKLRNTIYQEDIIIVDSNQDDNKNIQPNSIGNNLNLNLPGNKSDNTISIKMKKEIDLAVSNETLAELLCVLPTLTRSDPNKKISFAGNILTDLKKSYLDIYESFRQLKAKWKVIEYLVDFKEKKGGGNYLHSPEMNYLLSKEQHLEEIAKAEMLVHLNLSSVNFKIIDKLFFITYEKISSVTLKVKNVEISNSIVDKLPLLTQVENIKKITRDFKLNPNTNNNVNVNSVNYNIQEAISNFVKNSKTFDFDLINKVFFQYKLEIHKISVVIDDIYPFLDTNLRIKRIKSMIENVPFLPEEIIDMNSSFIKLIVTPSVQKVIYILSNMKYYQDLYGKKFEIASKDEEEIELSANQSDRNNPTSIIAHFHKKLQKNLLKILDNKKRYKNFISYLKNRNSLVFYYSIGKFNPKIPEEVNKDFGIFIEFKEYDSSKEEAGLNKLTRIPTKNAVILSNSEDSASDSDSSQPNPINNNRNSKGNKDESNIFTLHIPILIVNKRDTLFYEEKQIWLSDVFTYKVNSDPNLNFEKLKIKFDSDEKFNFTSFEFLYCKLFLNTLDYFLYNSEEIKSLQDIEFTSRDFPFDFKFSAPSKLKLNNLLAQKTFYFEQEENLRGKIYSRLFSGKKNKSGGLLGAFTFNIQKGEILSYLKISVEKVSFQIFAKNNSQIFKFYNNLRKFQKLEEDLKQNKFEIIEKEREKKEVLSNIVIKKPKSENYLGSTVRRPESHKYTQKISMHRIFIHIKDIKLKAFYEIQNSHSNPMVFLVVNNISYQENMNIYMHNLYSKEEISSLNTNPIVLSNLFISSVKLIVSIPPYFRKETNPEERVKVLDEKLMEEIFEKMKKEENKLIALTMGNISMKLIQKERSEIVFEVGDVIKLGFAKREGQRVDPENIDSSMIEPMIWIVTNKLIDNEDSFSENENNLNISNNIIPSNDNSNKMIQGTDIERNKIKDKLYGLEINSEFNYSINCTITPVKYQLKRRVVVEDKNSLLFNLFKTLKIIQSLLNLQTEYMLNISINVINVEIPWYVFNYVYFMRNHIRELKSILHKGSKINKDKDESNSEEDSGSENESEESLAINRKDTENNLNAQTSFALRPNRSTRGPISLKFEKMLSCKSGERFSIRRFSKVGRFFSKVPLNEPTQPKKEMKDKQYSMVKLFIPYFSLGLKQKSLRDEEIIFFDFSLIKIKGEVVINLQDRSKDILSVKMENLKWKPYESRYPDILIKHENNKHDMLEVDIKLGKSAANQMDELRNKILHPKEHPDDQVPIIGRLRNFTMVMLNKSIKELVLFFEQNSECLSENPTEDHYKLLDQIKKEDKPVFKMYISDSTLLLPESSQSANAIVLNVKEGSVLFKKTNEVPKLCVEPKPVMLYIDKKTALNIKPIMAEPHEYVPHSRIEINADDSSSFFYSNGEVEPFVDAKHLGITVKTVQNDSVVMSLRKQLWKKKFNANIVSYKPSILLDLHKATMTTSMGKLFSIKIYVDGNIDEKSSVLEDTNAKFDNIDFNMNIDSGSGRIDVFKIPETFTQNVEHIMNLLPNSADDLNLDPLNRNNKPERKERKDLLNK